MLVAIDACYARLLACALRRPSWVAGAAAVAVALTLSSYARLGTGFLPQLDEDVIWIRANLPAGISLEPSWLATSGC